MIAQSDKRPVQRPGKPKETKKVRLLQLVKNDPFLSVDEIAKSVETTPRYVRTALSEAGLSLIELRRAHAAKMKQRLRLDVRIPDAGGTGARLPGALAEAGIPVGIGSVRVDQVVDPEVARLLQAPPDTMLLQISRVRRAGQQPLYVNQLVTTQPLVVGEAMFKTDKSLIELLGLKDIQEAQFQDRTVDVVRSGSFLAEALDVPEDHPVLRLGNILTVAGKPAAIKYNYFDGCRIRLVIANVPGYALRLVDRDRDLTPSNGRRPP